jgi:hypothetical protein
LSGFHLETEIEKTIWLNYELYKQSKRTSEFNYRKN